MTKGEREDLQPPFDWRAQGERTAPTHSHGKRGGNRRAGKAV